MPIKNGTVYIDNTYAREVATCSTKAFIGRVLGLVAIDSQKDAAHVGSSVHAAIETYFKGGSKADAIAAFSASYDKLLGVEDDKWQTLARRPVE